MLPVKYNARSTQRELDKIDNKVNKIEAGGSPTTLAEDLAKGNSTGGNDINVTTGDDINFGVGSKSTYNDILKIYHDGFNSYVTELGAGDLVLWGAAKIRMGGPFSSSVLVVNANGSCELNFAGTKCLETISGGGVKVESTIEFGALKGATGTTVTRILDEDNMASNSNTALATQQSIKAYVDSQSATASELLTTLNGSITDSELADSLSDPIATIPTLITDLSTLTSNLNTTNGNISDLIDFTGYTDGYSGSDILARLGATEIVANSKVTTAQLSAEAAARTSAINASAASLQGQIDDLLAIEAYDNSTSYATDDQVTYNNKLYKAKQATTGNLPTNTTYWQLLGDYTSLGDTVGDNTASINAINTVTATSTSAAAQAISALNSTVNNGTTGVVATSNALDSVETLVNNTSTGVTASANKISVLESTVNNPTTGVAATSQALDTVETLVNDTSTGVTASANKISALESTVNNATTGVAATSNALDVVETLVNNSSTGVTASANKISALESTVNDSATGVVATSQALDTVETLVNNSSTGVTASANKISALESTVNDSATGVVATSNALDSVETLVNNSSTGVTALGNKISTLESTVNNPTTGVAATSNALDTVETLVNNSSTGVTASANKISALESTVNNATTGVAATSNALDTVETLVNDTDDGVAASASKISVLESSVNNPTTGLSAAVNNISAIENSIDDSNTGLTASANRLNSLESTVNNATTGVAVTSNALDVVETLVNDTDDGVVASANKISALESTVNNATTGVAATANALDIVETLVNDSEDGVNASANKISALESTVNNPTTGVSATANALDTVETLVNDSEDGINATAAKISTLNTTVGVNSASIQTQASTINGLTSQFTVKTDVSGKIAGFGLYNDATTGSEFAIAADRFFLTPSPDVTGTDDPTNNTQGTFDDIYYATGSKKYFASSGASSGGYIWNEIATPSPFVITTQQSTLGGETVPRGVYIDNAYIKNGSVDTLSIAGQAVTVPSTVATSLNTYYEEDDSTWITPVELNVNNSGAKTEIEGQLWFQPAYDDGLVSMNSIFTLLDIELHTKFYNITTYLGDSTTSNNNVCVTHRNSISHVITSLLTPPANTTRIEIDLKFRVKETGTAWGVNAITAKINALEVKK
jgi:archaellum component FlaC